MADNARGVHVSPGIYTRETELNYAVRSLGITTLGIAGETVKGPAFQPMDIANWREFQDVFGGTSTEKFKSSQYPKYELPYVAKSYLSESEQLKVVRVLGLSGYNAGPAWLVTASDGEGGNAQAVAVIRSRGTYEQYTSGSTTDCICEATKYDTIKYEVGEIESSANGDCQKKGYNLSALQIKEFLPLESYGDECEGYKFYDGESSFSVSQTNRGRFRLVGITGEHPDGTEPASGMTGYFEYSVSLNPLDKEYILNILGTNQNDGQSPIYVESLYDVALEQGIANGDIVKIDSGVTVVNGDASEDNKGLKGFQAYYTADFCHHTPVDGFATLPQSSLRRRMVGSRFLATKESEEKGIKCTPYIYKTNLPILDVDGKPSEFPMVAGQIYTVRQWTSQDGKRYYVYAYYDKDSVDATINDYADDDKVIDPTNLFGNLLSGGTKGMDGLSDTTLGKIGANKNWATLVYNNADGLYWRMNEAQDDVVFVELDMNDYKSAYRYASTPWIVSNLKGDKNHTDVSKLFRFHTISDGTNANYEVKVSIENVRPDDGVFDVVVRKIDDVDESIIPLEKFTRCTMIPGDANYIAYKIGSFDGIYESRSKYITVEVNETTAARTSVPCGFLGYPIPKFDGTPISGSGYTKIAFPTIMYNRTFDEDIKERKQYFGLSSWVGVDIDNFTFKGVKSYIEDPTFVSHGFHLDSRLDTDHDGISAVTVDGESGYVFDSVSINATTSILSKPPIIDTEENMYGSIYEHTSMRKFTVYFYGGFDGWDEYRDERTNTNDFKMTQYRGYVNLESGIGYSFDKIQNPSALGLNQNGITSDWYAYLSAIRQFANPEATDINVFATPGIDYVNQKLLVDEVIEMVEEERADSIYVVTTPDKPSGAGDYVDEMYSPEEIVEILEDTEIDSNYSCTYYPWVKYFDQDNNQYIFLPPTKDVVRNFAQTDNQFFPWFVPAGINRGDVDCVRAKIITKIGDEDVLYEGRINPIKTFAQDGPKIWGQKNLQINESQLNRIAVRRMMLRLRKLIAIACIGLIFEPNDASVKQSFISAISPILDSIRSNRGISDYKIEVNDSEESRERRELPAKIYIKPYNVLEYITIDFILSPQGVSFDNI